MVAKARHGYAKRGNIKSEYNAWVDMRLRCNNPSMSNYHLYGGRGISVCERWQDSFENFIADMGDKPGKHYSLDRIDNNGNYTPYNCRWATPKEQSRNTRRSKLVEYKGEMRPLSELAEMCGLSRQALNVRIFKTGLSVEDAITIPKGKVREWLQRAK